MTEIREIVAIEDRMRFDELVYRSEVDLPRRRDPREHDYRHSRVNSQKSLISPKRVGISHMNLIYFLFEIVRG